MDGGTISQELGGFALQRCANWFSPVSALHPVEPSAVFLLPTTTSHCFLLIFVVFFRVFQKDGVRVVVDPDSLDMIKGSKVHYSEQLIRSDFAIQDNPAAEKGCGCGTSFHLKEADLKKAFNKT